MTKSTAARLAPEQRQALLDNLDLEEEVRSRKLMSQAEEVCTSLRLQCEALIARMPAGVRNLTVEDFCNIYNGNVEEYLERQIKDEMSKTRYDMEQVPEQLEPKPAPTNSTTAPIADKLNFSVHLPETPSIKKLRRPRQNESLMSVNGSPIANPFQFEEDPEDEEELPFAAPSRNASLAPRRMTVRDLSRMESLGGVPSMGDISNLKKMLMSDADRLSCTWDDDLFDQQNIHKTDQEAVIEPLFLGLDFTYWASVKLTVRDVLDLKTHRDVLAVEEDPNMEMLSWMQVMDLKKNVYSKKMVLSEEYKLELEAKAARGDDDTLDDDIIPLDKLKLKACFEEKLIEVGHSPDANVQGFDELALLFIDCTGLTEFPYNIVRNDESMITAAVNVLKREKNYGTPSDMAITIQFQQMMKRLVDKGHISLLDVDRDLYVRIRYELNLGRDLVNIIRRASEDPLARTKDGGVPIDIIIYLVRTSPVYRNVPLAELKRSLAKLEKESLIYDVHQNEYKAF
ncbi:hypothetical protein HDV05_001665 [Chytridiales sp. JEL 0842]|nr:hypothetical protein HDV05_001665 [Chytridiales sp. JEL 0842]